MNRLPVSFILTLITLSPLFLFTACKDREPEKTEEDTGEHRHPVDVDVNDGNNPTDTPNSDSENTPTDDPNDPQSSPIIGNWIETTKSATKYTFTQSGTFVRYEQSEGDSGNETEVGEWSVTAEGNYQYYYVSDFLKLFISSSSASQEVTVEEYACKINGDQMTLTTLSGRSTQFRKQ